MSNNEAESSEDESPPAIIYTFRVDYPKRKEVYCTLQVEGTHNWPSCPFEEVDYLRAPHRHMFHITAFKQVSHSDRDVEFIMLKHEIIKYLKLTYYNDESCVHVFGAKSCEMIAEELINRFDLLKADVNEDNENGSVVYAY